MEYCKNDIFNWIEVSDHKHAPSLIQPRVGLFRFLFDRQQWWTFKRESFNLSSGPRSERRGPEEQGRDTTRHWSTKSVFVEYISNLVTHPHHNRQSFCPNLWRNIISRHFKWTHNLHEDKRQKWIIICLPFIQRTSEIISHLVQNVYQCMYVNLSSCNWLSVSLSVTVCMCEGECVYACVSV